MRVMLVTLTLGILLCGCTAAKGARSISPTDLYESGGSSLVYRFSRPTLIKSTIIIGNVPGQPKASLLNADWIRDMKWRDAGVGGGEIIRAITAPKYFPFSLAVTALDPIMDIFKQAEHVETKRLDTLGHTILREIWKPRDASKMTVKDGTLEITVEAKGEK